MRIDAHQHFWKYNQKDYAWIDYSMRMIKKDFLPQHLIPELTKEGFEGSISVQARQTLQETSWLLELSNSNDFIKGVVGWVDLKSRHVRSDLLHFAEHSKFVGVRHVVHDEEDDAFMLDKDFLRGISYLSDYNLTYDLLLFPKHLPIASRVACMFPEQRFVIDHISKPLIKQKIFESWADDIKEIAGLPNVFCKLSGMVTEADWINWQPEDFFPYIDVVMHAFGIDRVMIGSDWPVCLVAGSYSKVMSVVFKYISKLSASEQNSILGNNCERFYLKRN